MIFHPKGFDLWSLVKVAVSFGNSLSNQMGDKIFPLSSVILVRIVRTYVSEHALTETVSHPLSALFKKASLHEAHTRLFID